MLKDKAPDPSGRELVQLILKSRKGAWIHFKRTSLA
jgi:hypothetical protein